MAEKLLIVGVSATVLVLCLLISAVRSLWLIGKSDDGSLNVAGLIEEERRAQSE